MIYFRRSIEKALKDVQRSFPVTVITGPRQSGKSTLLNEFLKDLKPTVLSLDDPEIRLLLADNPRAVLESCHKPVIIDEIQYMPELTTFVKLLADKERGPGQWFITGSQQFNVMKDISESLAGRAAVLTLPPFSLVERGGPISLEGWLLGSSYPELIGKPDMNKKIWYSSYLQTYLERDVRMMLNVENLRDFEQCLRLLAARTGQVLRYSELAREVGVSVPTVKRWVSVLENSYIIFLLPPYFNNFGKRITKAPKIYFYDIGLVNFLVGLESFDHLINGPMAGALFETAVIGEVLKQRFALGVKPELYYWRSQSGTEVDLLIPDQENMIPCEIKLSTTVKPGFYKNIRYWLSLSKNKEGKGYLFSNCEKRLPLPGNIKNIFWRDVKI